MGLFDFWRNNNDTEYLPYKDSPKAVRSLLKKMKIVAKEDDKDKACVHFVFEYQGGYFVITATKDSYMAVLHMSRIFSCDFDYVNLVSYQCNRFNVANVLKLNHVYDEMTNSVDVNIEVSFNVMDTNLAYRKHIKSLFSACFELRRDFVCAIDDLIKNNQDKSASDIYDKIQKNRRSRYLLFEHEAKEHRLFLKHTSANSPYQLSSILRLFQLEQDSVTQLQFMTSESTDLLCIKENEAILNFDLREAMRSKLAHFVESAHIVLRYSGFNITIDINSESDLDERSVYYSVTLYRPWNMIKGQDSIPEPRHFMLAFDAISSEERAAEVRYMLDDAMDKLQDGRKDELLPEQKMALDFDEWGIRHDIYWGDKCFYAHRYYEAIHHYEPVLQCLNKNFSLLGRKNLDSFYDLYYKIGFCYSDLGLYSMALYYLEVPFSVGTYHGAVEYINCLCNSKDFRAVNVIERQLKMLKDHINEQDENEGENADNDYLYEYQNFLLRRLAYSLIESNQLDQAESCLKSMLNMDDPSMKNFAIDELSYIDGLRKEKEANEQKSSQEENDSSKELEE